MPSRHIAKVPSAIIIAIYSIALLHDNLIDLIEINMLQV